MKSKFSGMTSSEKSEQLKLMVKFILSALMLHALRYSRPENALAYHVDKEDKKIFNLNPPLKKGSIRKRGNPNVTIINESGLYSLVLASKLDGSKKFKRWVTSEVLPTIRKKGDYNLNSEPPRAENMNIYLTDCKFFSIINEKN